MWKIRILKKCSSTEGSTDGPSQIWIYCTAMRRARAVLTSFSLSDILVDGCVFLPPVMDRTAPILYHILECGFESTNLEGEERKADASQDASDQLSIIRLWGAACRMMGELGDGGRGREGA